MSRIIVKNLPQTGISESDLRKHFADIDNVTDIKLKYNDHGTFRRFAFVGFKSDDAAERAIDKLNSTYIKTNKISVEPCKAIRDVKSDSNKNNNVKKTSVNPKTEKRQKLNEEAKNAFDDLKDDPEFKEFMNLQDKKRYIWSDDAKMDVEQKNQSNLKDESEVKNDKEPGKKIDADFEPRHKRHKRSRPKKKSAASAKTKPKEIFEHTMKVKGVPENTRRKDVIDFFKPLQLLSVRLNKKDRVCYVSFKDERDLKFALRKDMQFWNTSRIKCVKHNVQRSKLFKQTLEVKAKEKEERIKKQAATLANTEPVEESGRLFVRNLNYTCRQEDLEEVFSKYGELTEVHFPIDKNTSLPKGYAYVEYMFPKNAAIAYENLNGTIFQGRNFHLIPAKPKPERSFDSSSQGQIGNMGKQHDSSINQSSFKREKLTQQKQSAPKGSNWNILFLGQNALADIVSDTRGVDKSKLLTQQSHKDPIAVRMALGDATVVDEMRKFLISNGIELDSFDNPQAPRSRTVILVKNLPSLTNKNELQQLFEPHGRVARVIMPPNGLTGIVEMEEPVEAKLAFKRLAYSKFKDTVLYLEWAPINVFREKSIDDQEQDEMKQLELVQTGTKILVKNVPFEATQQELRKIFATYGELNFVRLPKKVDGQHRGFCFVDFLTKEDALRAYRALCHSTHLYGRKLVLEWAKVEDATSGVGHLTQAKRSQLMS